MDRSDSAFTCYRDKENEDVELLTTQDPSTILTLLARFGMDKEIAHDLKSLLQPTGAAKFVTVMLHHLPTPECTYAYTGILEYSADGLESGYVVVFRSRSGDFARIEAECNELHAFLSEKLENTRGEPVAQ